MTDYTDLKRLAEDVNLHTTKELSAIREGILALIAENEALRPDAQRYRFIKLDEQMGLVEDLAYNIADVEWDAEIDAVMAKETGNG